MKKELSKYACKDSDGIKIKSLKNGTDDTFFKDIDKIIYSLSYVRYMNKTQVFSFKSNDHIQKRMVHIQYVSKIARTIGRALNLNEDLIEAMALGHDLGHVPYGHVGEKILNRISLEHNMGYFNHNVHSVRLLMEIENYGKGLDINYQVLDGILCHNGEVEQKVYFPKEKSVDDFISEYKNTYKNENNKLIPSTLEGCVIKISDIISYLGRDIEDAYRVGLICKDDIPNDIKKVLGDNNSKMIDTIVTDIINNSKNNNYIKISDNVYDAISKLKTFNYKYIYNKAYTSKEKDSIENKFNLIFNKFYDDLCNNNTKSSIYKSYLINMSDDYKQNSKERIVIDYIAGMTDDYFEFQCNEINKA